MSKFIKTSVDSGFQTTQSIESNLSDLETFSDTCLTRDGKLPNNMLVALDMGSNRAINGADALNASDFVTLRQLQAAQSGTLIGGEASLVNFKADFTQAVTTNVGNAIQGLGASFKFWGIPNDGITNASPAMQNAIDDILAKGGGCLQLGPGTYKMDSKITISTVAPICIQGTGRNTILEWNFDDHLFEWTVSCVRCEVRNLRVHANTTFASPYASAMIYTGVSCEQGWFKDLQLMPKPGVGGQQVPSGIVLKTLADTSNIDTFIILGELRGTGLEIGAGSEIRLSQSRFIGQLVRGADPAKGIHITGGAGGVYITNCDMSGLGFGCQIDNSNSASPNREVFIDNTSLDSCNLALNVESDVSVKVQGGQLASCDQANFRTGGSLPPSIRVAMTNVDIFNAGGLTDLSAIDLSVGYQQNSGTFTLVGCEVRNNKGRGLHIANAAVSGWTVVGGKIVTNGQGGAAARENITTNGTVGVITGVQTQVSSVADQHFGTVTRFLNNSPDINIARYTHATLPATVPNWVNTVRLDTSGGPAATFLPPIPSVGDNHRIEFTDITGSFLTNNLVITPTAGDTFEGFAFATMSQNWQTFQFTADAVTRKWNITYRSP